MWGDFEAQRHWIEVTTHLPVSEWYWGRHESNSLLYWGLDYPPLTAYHSKAIGLVADRLLPASFRLLVSRGAQDVPTRQFMRLSVVLSDLLSYIPAVILFVSASDSSSSSALAFALLQPALLIIDHGHFQYNGVCLGLVALAALLMTSQSFSRQLMGSALFVLALNFKHMALYFALPVFVLLLALNLDISRPGRSIWRIGCIGVVVILTFALLWAPFLLGGWEDTRQVFIRLFPLARGIFEDKVANAWCVLGPLFRFKERWSHEQLFRLAAVATLLSQVPGCFMLFLAPRRRMFALALSSCAMGFFLFAFQVHEKNILMPLLPISLLFGWYPELASWAVLIGCFSMFPLLERDGLVLAYWATWAVLLFAIGRWNRWSIASTVPMLGIHILMFAVPPPVHLPHLWIMGCMAYSFFLFALLYVLLLWLQWKLWSGHRTATRAVQRNKQD